MKEGWEWEAIGSSASTAPLPLPTTSPALQFMFIHHWRATLPCQSQTFYHLALGLHGIEVVEIALR